MTKPKMLRKTIISVYFVFFSQFLAISQTGTNHHFNVTAFKVLSTKNEANMHRYGLSLSKTETHHFNEKVGVDLGVGYTFTNLMSSDIPFSGILSGWTEIRHSESMHIVNVPLGLRINITPRLNVLAGYQFGFTFRDYKKTETWLYRGNGSGNVVSKTTLISSKGNYQNQLTNCFQAGINYYFPYNENRVSLGLMYSVYPRKFSYNYSGTTQQFRASQVGITVSYVIEKIDKH